MRELTVLSPLVFPLPTLDDLRLSGPSISRITRLYDELGIRYARINNHVVLFKKSSPKREEYRGECTIPLRFEKDKPTKPPKDISTVILRSRIIHRGSPCTLPIQRLNNLPVIIKALINNKEVLVHGIVERDTLKVRWIVVDKRTVGAWIKVFKLLRYKPIKFVEIVEFRY